MIIKYLLRPLVINLLINALALYSIVHFFPERLVITGGIGVYIIAGIIIGLLNTIVKPILRFVSFPFIVLSLGLFLVLINGFILFLTESIVHALNFEGMSMAIQGGFWSYLIVAVFFGILNWIIGLLLK